MTRQRPGPNDVATRARQPPGAGEAARLPAPPTMRRSPRPGPARRGGLAVRVLRHVAKPEPSFRALARVRLAGGSTPLPSVRFSEARHAGVSRPGRRATLAASLLHAAGRPPPRLTTADRAADEVAWFRGSREHQGSVGKALPCCSAPRFIRENQWTVIRLAGELDLLARPVAVGVIDGVMNAGSHRIILDFADLTFIDTSGGVEILRMQQKAQRTGVDLFLAGLRHHGTDHVPNAREPKHLVRCRALAC